ncbi:MAG: hypothetical protein DWQ47_03860 [Acidobacteria bacterium]|nr:MAG: hypothetical protein DWQ32_07410 [Acidobacteriota bacterium]REK01530.1 MAG: hypothetical protein DWQ38_03845 [Acidobacteriota bacterium]REK14486.1 MAG: hypothetical protein DWQ43_13100 [Acidobacteriota bacterium]REK45201.1 MAG: hypothetical protein DWQ47_03860 [Acidobacteriota bacterium]
MTARDHNRLLGIFFMILGGLTLLGALGIGLIYGGMGTMLIAAGPDEEAAIAGGIFVVLAIGIAFFLLVFSIFFLISGWKVYKEAQIGKILGIIASVLSLTSFPLGTALGAYGLWFFLGEQGKSLYDGLIHRNAPPPNSWQ